MAGEAEAFVHAGWLRVDADGGKRRRTRRRCGKGACL